MEESGVMQIRIFIKGYLGDSEEKTIEVADKATKLDIKYIIMELEQQYNKKSIDWDYMFKE